MYLLCSNGGTFSFNQGDLWALLTAVSVAGALVFGEKSLKATDAITISAIQTFITAVISIAGALLFDDISTITKIQPEAGLLLSIWLLHVPAWLIFCKTLP
jgi:drug/metabolite transporter (DMT)-like permease